MTQGEIKEEYLLCTQHTKCFHTHISFNIIIMLSGRILTLEVRNVAIRYFKWINQDFSINKHESWFSDSKAIVFN